MEKMRMESVDIVAQNVEKIESLFPNCITEVAGKDGRLKKAVDFDKLKRMLSPDIGGGDTEHYEFTWVGKRASMAEANKPIRKTLRPCKEESKNWDITENLYIEGDNLDVLKLLQESYLGKVKMIYIDPPYNTGNDFIYKDDFSQTVEEYEEAANTFDEENNRLVKNTDTNGRFHSDWCSMIYPRLMLARNLLSDDGVIFISIDDSEQENLKKICDEIFGECNFYGNFIWQKRTGSMDAVDNVSEDHEYVMCFSKNKTKLKGNERSFSRYKNSDNDPRGPWIADNLTAGKPGGDVWYPIYDPNTGNEFYPPKGRYWPYNRKTMQLKIAEGRIIFPKNKDGRPMLKRFQNEAKNIYVPVSTIMRNYNEKNIPNNALLSAFNVKGTNEIQELFKEKVFPFPKSTILLKSLLSQIDEKNNIILDFFSGSATTAHAVMQLNAEDGGKRKFIMVQLPEKTDEKSEAFKAGYKNICEIGKERIRRAGEKIKAEAGFNGENLDIGFRVFKLDSTNMNDVYYSAGEYNQQMLANLESNIKSDRTDMDLLFGCLLDWGLPLSLPYISEQIDGFTVHTYNDGDLIACFAENVSEKVIEEIARRQPLRAVFRDSSFADSPAKINVWERFKLLAPDTQVKVI